MTKLIQQLLPIEKDELSLTGYTFLQSFLLGIPKIMTLTAGNTLFISAFGADMIPLAYIGSSILLPIIGIVLSKIEDRFSLNKRLTGLILVLFVSQIVFCLLLNVINAPWPSLILLVWYDIEWALISILFWNMTNRLYSVRQAKRLFGLLGAGDVLAAVIGGLLVPVLVQIAGTKNLLLFSAAAYIVAFLNLKNIQRLFSDKLHIPGDTAGMEKNKEKGGGGIFSNPYITSIFGYIALAYAVYYFVDFSFYNRLEANFQNQQDMAGFIGIFFGCVSVASLLFSSLFTNKYLKRFGLAGGLLAIPVTLFIINGFSLTAGILDISDMLIFILVVSLKFANDFLAKALHAPSYRTLYQVLPPEVRGKAQTWGDTIISQSAGGIAGLILLGLKQVLPLSYFHVAFILVAVLCTLAFFARRSAAGYAGTLENYLASPGFKGMQPDFANKKAIELLLSRVTEGDSREITHCLDILDGIGYEHMENLLVELLDSSDTRVVKKVYNIIEEKGYSGCTAPLMEELSKEHDPLTKHALLRALGSSSGGEAFEDIKPFLANTEPETKMGAIISLIRYCGIQGAIHAGGELLALLDSEDDSRRIDGVKALGIIGTPGFFHELQSLLGDRNFLVRKEAVKTAGILNNSRLWPQVIENLSHGGDLGRVCSRALEKGGASVLPYLTAFYGAKTATFEQKELIIGVVGTIPGKESVDILVSWLTEPDKNLRLELLFSLEKLDFKTCDKWGEIIAPLLEEEVSYTVKIAALIRDFSNQDNQVINRDDILPALGHELVKSKKIILKLLAFLYPQKDLSAVEFSLNSGSSENADFAIEVLDTTLDKEHRKIVLPLFEETDPGAFLEKMKTFMAVSPEKGVFRLWQLVEDTHRCKNSWIKALAFESLAKSSFQKVRKYLAHHLKSGNPLLRETASVLLKQGGRDIPGRVRTLGRVDFLRTIPGEFLAGLAFSAEEKRISPGETIFHEGDAGSSLYVIQSGRVEIHTEGNSIAVLKEGECFGEWSALVPEKRRATATALEAATLICLDSESLYTGIHKQMELARNIISSLCLSLRQKIIASSSSSGEIIPAASQLREIKNNNLSHLEKIILLKRADIFSGTSDDILMEMARRSGEVVLGEKSVLFNKGEPGSTLYIIASGSISVFNEKRVIATLEKGSVIGELAALASETRTASASALKEATLISIDQSDLYTLMKDQREVLLNIIKVLVERLRASSKG